MTIHLPCSGTSFCSALFRQHAFINAHKAFRISGIAFSNSHWARQFYDLAFQNPCEVRHFSDPSSTNSWENTYSGDLEFINGCKVRQLGDLHWSIPAEHVILMISHVGTLMERGTPRNILHGGILPERRKHVFTTVFTVSGFTNA